MNRKNLLTGLALAVLSIFFAGLSTLAAPNEPDIVGGEEAVPGAWPWQVALVHSDAVNMYDGQFCGGVLVDEWWVLTAAHCVTDQEYTDVDVVVGAHNLFKPETNVQRISSRHFIVHPDYSAATNDSDIALIQLVTPATLTAGSNDDLPVQPITLVATDVGTLEGELSTVTGWGNRSAQPTPGGFDYPETLHQVELPILSNEACNEAFEANYLGANVTENMMCAGFQYKGGRDSCFGDSGGPLMVQGSTTSNWNLAGLVSWGHGCAMPGLPGVYTRVSQFTPWVTATMERPIVILEKSAAAPAITPGDGLSYTLSLQNVGTVLVSNLVISDTIPAGTSLVPNSISNGGFLENGMILWNVPPLQPNGSFSGEFAVEVGADYLTSLVHFSDNLEGDLAAWTVAHDPAYANSDWFVSGYLTHSGSSSWFAPNLGQVGDQYLILNVPGVLPPRMELSFWHYFDLETWYDGGVIEISTDNGATWGDLGHLIFENDYTFRLDDNTLNPLAGRLAFSDYTFDWIQTRVDLHPYAGQAIQIRFRLGTDEVFGYYGWNVDDVVIRRISEVSNQAFVNGVPSNVTETAVVSWLPTNFAYFPVLGPPSAGNQPPTGYP